MCRLCQISPKSPIDGHDRRVTAICITSPLFEPWYYINLRGMAGIDGQRETWQRLSHDMIQTKLIHGAYPEVRPKNGDVAPVKQITCPTSGGVQGLIRVCGSGGDGQWQLPVCQHTAFQTIEGPRRNVKFTLPFLIACRIMTAGYHLYKFLGQQLSQSGSESLDPAWRHQIFTSKGIMRTLVSELRMAVQVGYGVRH